MIQDSQKNPDSLSKGNLFVPIAHAVLFASIIKIRSYFYVITMQKRTDTQTVAKTTC